MTVSWLTVILAGFRAAYEAREAWTPRQDHAGRNGERDVRFFRTVLKPFAPAGDSSPDGDDGYLPRRMRQLNALLSCLCDLQVITGVGIMLSAFAQWHVITYYHEQLVIQYWNLTLNSFWAVRVSYMNYDSADAPWRVGLRRLCVLVSCGLSTVWQFA